jgi:hypothetical protein
MQEQAAALAGDVDWSRLTTALRMRKLLALLGPRIVEMAGGAADENFVTAVEQAVENGRLRGAFLQLIALRVMDSLTDAGIRCSPLKGPMLGEAIHGDPGRRLSNDIDVLVAPDQLHTAVEVVRGLGYGAPSDYVDSNGLPRLHFAVAHEQGTLPPVELHWRVHWYEARFACERLLPPALDTPREWRPDPADELVSLLLFYARDGFIDLRLAADLGAWWDLRGSELPIGAVDELLDAYLPLSRAIHVGVKVAENVIGLPGAMVLEQATRLDLRSRTAVRLANPNPRSSQAQLYADRGLIDGLLVPPGGFIAFVRRQVLPPSEVLNEHARNAPRQRARSPLGRGAGILGRYGLTMARLVHAPETLRRETAADHAGPWH